MENQLVKTISALKLLELPLDKPITLEQIRTQYRKLCLVYHPDLPNSPFSDGKKFTELQDSMNYLTNNLSSVNQLILSGAFVDRPQPVKKPHVDIHSVEDDRNEEEYYKEILKKKKEKQNHKSIGLIVGITIVAIMGLVLGAKIAQVHIDNKNHTTSAKQVENIVSTPAPKPTLQLIPAEAYNGKIIKEPDYEAICPLEVNTKGDGWYYVYLRYIGPTSRHSDVDRVATGSGQNSDLSFLVQGGNSVEIDAPVGSYQFYYCYGNTWYGVKNKFGPNTVAETSTEKLNFYVDGNTAEGVSLELWLQSSGNFSTREIDVTEFPG